MWGNRIGWMISAAIVIVTVGLYAMLLTGPSATLPTALSTHAGAMDAITLPGVPRSLVPAGGGEDGTSLYQQAIAAYKAQPSLYDPDKVGKVSLKPEDLKKLQAIEFILEAASASKATIFATKPEQIIRYGAAQFEALKPLDDLGRMTMNLGVRLKIAKKPDLAKKYLEAAFDLGYTMCNERVVYMEFFRGQEFMQNAALNLASVDTAHAEQFNAFPPQMKFFLDSKAFTSFRDAIRTVDPKAIERNAGDVFKIAQDSEDRMWRVEAIMAMGHFRYMAVNPGDQRTVEKTLAKIGADSSQDPAVLAAVKAAQNLTLADHNTSAQMP